MRVHKLFITWAVLLVLGLASLWSKWNGNAGVNADWPVEQWGLTFNGSVHGWPALIGILLILAAIIVFLLALIKTVIGPAKV